MLNTKHRRQLRCVVSFSEAACAEKMSNDIINSKGSEKQARVVLLDWLVFTKNRHYNLVPTSWGHHGFWAHGFYLRWKLKTSVGSIMYQEPHMLQSRNFVWLLFVQTRQFTDYEMNHVWPGPGSALLLAGANLKLFLLDSKKAACHAATLNSY